MKKYPQIYKVFEKTIKQRWEDFKTQGKPMFNETAEEYLESWYRKQGILFLETDQRGFFNL